jgi:hypothetical protein
MVHFDQVDSFSHLFMKYAPLKLEWVPDQASRATAASSASGTDTRTSSSAGS